MKIKKILSGFALLITAFLFFNFGVNATEYVNGDIENGTITIGGNEQDGGVKLTKELTKVNNTGLYKVEFKLDGKDATITNQKNIYVVVIFDRSGSMLCNSGTEKSRYGSYEYNGEKLKCSSNTETPNATKWESAVSGAISFSTGLLADVPTAKLSLLTFGSDATDGTSFASTAFSSDRFSYPYGSTNLDSAIRKATYKLDAIKDPKASKYIVIISDGKPDDVSDSISEAAITKGKGIKIYSIGYETNDEAKTTLQTISSNNTCYDASSTELVNVLKNISNDITQIPAGTNAILTDTIGDDFTYVSSENSNVVNNGKTVTYNFGTIAETEKSFDFLIQLTLPANTPWHNTNNVSNNGVSLSYTDFNNHSATLGFESTPKVYWLTKYNYTIKYYKDNVDEENLLGTETKSDVLGTEINEVDKTLYIPRGYIFKETAGFPLTIVSQESDNVIYVVYEKNNKITYKVEYYYDGIIDNTKTAIIENQVFGSIVTVCQDKSGSNYKLKSSNLPYTLDLENNVIKIYYQKIVVNQNEIVPPKTGIEGESYSLLYATPLLLLFLKKKLF
jgi:uncharacterized protein YegL